MKLLVLAGVLILLGPVRQLIRWSLVRRRLRREVSRADDEITIMADELGRRLPA